MYSPEIWSSDPGLLIPILAILLSFVVAMVVIVGGFVMAFIKAWRGGKAGQLDSEQAQAFQEIQRGFQRMEDRVEALETLIIEQEQSAKAHRDYESRDAAFGLTK